MKVLGGFGSRVFGELVDPSHYQHSGKAHGETHDQGRLKPHREAERLDDDVAELQQDPSANHVQGANAKDLAALQFGDKR